ncbi:MAG: TetR/AcrR family transcriptional regulator [Bacteriovoracaceae bacterium]|nr:TetR/AcrR family transcriptional regulator [Bacteriovoracaceae bacterium]
MPTARKLRGYSSKSRKEQKEITKSSIKKVALNLFYKKGKDNTSIAEIAKKANIAGGTFYFHFEDKDQLIEELIQEFNDKYIERFQNVFVDGIPENGDELLFSICSTFLDHFKENKKVVSIIVEKMKIDRGLQGLAFGASPELINFLTHILEIKAKQQGVSIEDPELIIHALFGMWLRVGLQYLFNKQVTKEKSLAVLTRLTQGAIKQYISLE